MPSISNVSVDASAEARDSLLERAFRAAAPILVPWFGEDVLRDSLASELDRDLDPKNAQSQHSDAVRVVRLAGNPPRWIVVKLVHNNDGRTSHLSIKHRSFDIATDADADALVNAALAAFEHESVQRICIARFASDSDLMPPSAQLQTSIVAAPIRKLILPAETPVPPDLHLRQPDSLAFYDTYELWYREFWERRQDLFHQVPIESREDLEQCMAKDGVRLIHLGDAFCGVLAAERREEFGLKGWRIREKVIAPAYWGRGLAAPATVQFAQSLPHQPDDALWGTIVPGNHASLRSAETIGRRVIGSLHVV